MSEILYLIQKFLTFITVPFLQVVNLSITAGWVVLAVFLIRLMFRKAPKWLNCVLWGIVGLRLVFPFSLESVFSLIPSTQTIDPTMPYLNDFEINSGIEPLDSAVNTHYADFVPMAERTVDVTIILACVWLLGAGIMLAYAFVSWAKLRHSLKTATKKEGNIYHSEFVSSPFVLGIFRPKIYIPYNVNEAELVHVVAHEKAHISRRDYLIKPFGFLLLSIHWFNPLMWLAYILLCRDIEAACDEKVIRKLGKDERKNYSLALLNSSISRKSIAACPLAFGETGVKERIKGVMNYKKPAFWVVIAAVVVCIVTALCFLTNPKDAEGYDYTPEISAELDNLISTNIIEHNQGSYLEGMVSCEAHEILVTKTKDNNEDFNGAYTISVYLVSLYQEYSLDNGKLIDVSGGMTPLVLSYAVGDEGENPTYVLYDYWEPGMGSSYAVNLKAKFPPGVDYDTQSYVKELEAECEKQALAYFGVGEDAVTQVYTEDYSTKAVFADYTVEVLPSKSNGGTWLTNRNFFIENGYHVYLSDLEECYVYKDGKKIYIGTALNEGIISGDTLVENAQTKAEKGEIRSDMLKDGGTRFYWFEDYTLIKRNSIVEYGKSVSHNKDLIIGPADMTTTQYSNFLEFLSGTNAGEEDYSLAVNTPTSDIRVDSIENLPAEIASLSITVSGDRGISSLTDVDIYKKYGYNVWSYSVSAVDVKTADGKTYELSSALNKVIVTPETVVAAAQANAVDTVSYDDGGSVLYVTNDYAVIKLNTLDGRKDVIIGPADMTLDGDINSFFNEKIGVTAPVGYDDGPYFEAKVLENQGGQLFVEVTDAGDSGMQQGTQAYVSLKSVLSHIELPEAEKGDELRIIFDGTVQETYPCQIPTVWAIYDVIN